MGTGRGKVFSVLLSVRHEDAWGSEGIAQPILTSALGGSERSPSRPGCFHLPGKSPRYQETHCMRKIRGFEATASGTDANSSALKD
jgi:hypothetical protein